jgi:hypothetical protein
MSDRDALLVTRSYPHTLRDELNTKMSLHDRFDRAMSDNL